VSSARTAIGTITQTTNLGKPTHSSAFLNRPTFAILPTLRIANSIRNQVGLGDPPKMVNERDRLWVLKKSLNRKVFICEHAVAEFLFRFD
jgi:hypothetical protein